MLLQGCHKWCKDSIKKWNSDNRQAATLFGRISTKAYCEKSLVHEA